MMLTPDQVANVRRWQDAGHVHPLTCGNCHCRSPMAVIDDGSGLRCVHCKHVQNWVPEVCLAGPPENPFATGKAMICLPPANRGEGMKMLPTLPLSALEPDALDALAYQWLTHLYAGVARPVPFAKKDERHD